jgi:hypothetical protein
MIPSQHEYVKGAQEWNTEALSDPYDDSNDWVDAHYPRPQGAGESTTPLTFFQHQFQGVLQSKEEGRCCFYHGDVLGFLKTSPFFEGYFELWDLYDKWVKDNGRRTAEKGIGVHDPEKKKNGGHRSAELKVGAHAPGVQAMAGKKAAEMGVGAHALGMSEKGGRKAAELGLGVHAPGVRERGGRKTAELQVGVCAPGLSSKGGTRASELKAGVHDGTKVICLTTGFITNRGSLTNYQKARGIPTYLRAELGATGLVPQVMLMGLTSVV